MLNFVCALLIAPQAAAPPDAATILKQMTDKVSQAADAKMTVRLKGAGQNTTLDLKIKKPNLIWVVANDQEMHSNGKEAFLYSPARKEYMKAPADAFVTVFRSGLLGFEGIFDVKPSYKAVGKAKSGFFMGKPSYVIVLAPANAGEPIGFFGNKVTLYVDKSTNLPLGFTSTEQGVDSTQTYEAVTLGASLTEADFAWTPPADAKAMDVGGGAGSESANLLKEGAAAPDFSLKTPDKGTLSLKSKLGQKATIVNFWFYG